MKYLKQMAVLGTITLVSELLNLFLPLPVPASIYGLIILFILLCTGILKLDMIENLADFMLSLMPLLFVAPTVGLMTRWDILRDNLIGLLITCIVSAVIVMAVTGWIAQLIIRARHIKDNDQEDVQS